MTAPELDRADSRGAVMARDDTAWRDARAMLEEGRHTFRYDTFGDEAFWGGTLRIHDALQGAALGGVGDGVSPELAPSVGLKVDGDALLNGLFTRTKGGFYHDGRFATLADVVQHYDQARSLALSASEKADLTEFLRSL